MKVENEYCKKCIDIHETKPQIFDDNWRKNHIDKLEAFMVLSNKPLMTIEGEHEATFKLESVIKKILNSIFRF